VVAYPAGSGEKAAGRGTIEELENRRHRQQKLSNREYQRMPMITSGETTAQIANELSLGISTISTYLGKWEGNQNLAV
jgi:DNA-binding CsgD family transcriptional regulator